MSRIIGYEYDRTHHPTRVSVDGKTVQRIAWTANGEVASITRGDRTTAYDYDGSGRIVRVRRSSESSGASGTTEISYGRGPEGDSETIIGENGATTRYYYDAWRRRVGEETGSGRTETWKYSPEGRMLAHINRFGGEETIAYNDDGTPRAKQTGNMAETTLIWNADGTIGGETDPDGADDRYEYDGRGKRNRDIEERRRDALCVRPGRPRRQDRYGIEDPHIRVRGERPGRKSCGTEIR
jgi:YD repeat-containing protein